MVDLTTSLKCSGLDVQALDPADASRFFKLWCEAFLEPVRVRMGRFRYRGLHWHAFSYKLVAALDREEALEQYRQVPADPVLIIPESWSQGCGVRCVGAPPPDLTPLREDLYVFPESMDWTMAFTHEHPDYGPYFVRREWCTVAG